jgi:acyl carrier protein
MKNVNNGVEESIRTYIAENLLFRKRYPYADATSFLEKGIVDSMGIMELVMFVEEQFNTTVEDHELTPDNFDSVSQLADYVRRKQDLPVG